MIEFEEPDKGYVFEGSNITKSKPKIRIAILFLFLSVIIVFFVKNDYDFNFFKINKAVANFECSVMETFDAFDAKQLNAERAKKALEKNNSLLASEIEFNDAKVDFEMLMGNSGAKNEQPVINLYFSGETELQIPTTMCGFNVNVFYK